MNRPAMGSSYMPQLDALRVVAVAAVLVHHFMDLEALPWVLGQVNWGILGVRLFFVLSGFLITGILMRARKVCDESGRGYRVALRQFYARRILRIFPLYYFVIAVTLALNVGPVREILVWLVTYTSNIYVAARGEWIHAFSHFWSLAVEEQFYLVWPLVVLFAPRKYLVPASLLLIVTGPAYRWYAVSHGFSTQALRCFTLTALDTLGAGALLAMAVNSNVPRATVRAWLNRVVLPAGIAGVLLFEFLLISGTGRVIGTVGLDLALSMIFAWLIGSAAAGFRGPIGSLLEWKPLVFTGRVTYGIYVYHFFLPVVYASVLPVFGWTAPRPGLLNLTISTLVSVGAASLSWIVLERPINNLKRHFDYHPVERAPVAVRAIVRPADLL
jgi:peptidoglycan/LPS O-acetylase OafA/YrhL